MKNKNNLLKDNLRSYSKYKRWMGYSYPKLLWDLDKEYAMIQAIDFSKDMTEGGGNQNPSARLTAYSDKKQELQQKYNMYAFMIEHCDRILKMVKPEYQEVLNMYAKTDYSLVQIAKATNYSHTRVHEIVDEETIRLQDK